MVVEREPEVNATALARHCMYVRPKQLVNYYEREQMEAAELGKSGG